LDNRFQEERRESNHFAPSISSSFMPGSLILLLAAIVFFLLLKVLLIELQLLYFFLHQFLPLLALLTLAYFDPSSLYFDPSAKRSSIAIFHYFY